MSAATAPPPLPPPNPRRLAIWSIALAGFVWVALLAIVAISAAIHPSDQAEPAATIIAIAAILLAVMLFASLLLAILSLVRRRRGTILAVFALLLSGGPLAFFALVVVGIAARH